MSQISTYHNIISAVLAGGQLTQTGKGLLVAGIIKRTINKSEKANKVADEIAKDSTNKYTEMLKETKQEISDNTEIYL